MTTPILKRQLRKAGSQRKEAKQLAAVAKQISSVGIPGLNKTSKQQIAQQIGFGYQRRQLALIKRWETAAAVLLITILVFAQSAKPGSALYSVRKGTTAVRSFVQDKVPFIDSSGHDSIQDQAEPIGGGASNGSDDNSGRGGSGDSRPAGSAQTSGHGGLEDNSLPSGSSGSTVNTRGDTGGSGSSGKGGSGSGKDINKTEDH